MNRRWVTEGLPFRNLAARQQVWTSSAPPLAGDPLQMPTADWRGFDLSARPSASHQNLVRQIEPHLDGAFRIGRPLQIDDKLGRLDLQRHDVIERRTRQHRFGERRVRNLAHGHAVSGRETGRDFEIEMTTVADIHGVARSEYDAIASRRPKDHRFRNIDKVVERRVTNSIRLGDGRRGRRVCDHARETDSESDRKCASKI